MKLSDLPITLVVDGKRPKVARSQVVALTREQELELEVAALRRMLEQAQDVYRESVGCIVRMVNVRRSPNACGALRRVREHGRAFLVASGAQSWDKPTGCAPTPLRRVWR